VCDCSAVFDSMFSIQRTVIDIDLAVEATVLHNSYQTIVWLIKQAFYANCCCTYAAMLV
jgi:hypothetical protein